MSPSTVFPLYIYIIYTLTMLCCKENKIKAICWMCVWKYWLWLILVWVKLQKKHVTGFSLNMHKFVYCSQVSWKSCIALSQVTFVFVLSMTVHQWSTIFQTVSWKFYQCHVRSHLQAYFIHQNSLTFPIWCHNIFI